MRGSHPTGDSRTGSPAQPRRPGAGAASQLSAIEKAAKALAQLSDAEWVQVKRDEERRRAQQRTVRDLGKRYRELRGRKMGPEPYKGRHMLRHKCNWVSCDACVAGRLPRGWARIIVAEPDLDNEGCWEEADYLLRPQHLVELRAHLRTEPTIQHEPPDLAKIKVMHGEPPPQPCIWKGCERKSSRRFGGSIVIFTDENRLLRSTVGMAFQGESDLCAIHMAALADFLQHD